MSIPRGHAAALASLPNLLPRNYFQGIRGRNLCLADNIVVFHRTEKRSLQQRNFESRPHHRFVLIVCFETPGSVNVDGHAYQLQPGTAFLIKPYQFHFYMDIASDTVSWLFITFEGRNLIPFESFANTPTELGATEQDRCLAIARGYSLRDQSDDSTLDLLALSACTLLTQIRSLAQKRSASLIRKRSSTDGYAIVEKINHILENRPDEAVGIHELATRLALSESHLRKRFKSLTGLSLGSYLVHYKLNRAVKLLAHSDASLTQVSVDCGYESLAAFSRCFKQKLGLSPSLYRKRALQDSGSS